MYTLSMDKITLPPMQMDSIVVFTNIEHQCQNKYAICYYNATQDEFLQDYRGYAIAHWITHKKSIYAIYEIAKRINGELGHLDNGIVCSKWLPNLQEITQMVHEEIDEFNA